MARSTLCCYVITGTQLNNPSKTVPTVTDNAQELGFLDEYALGIAFSPFDPDNLNNAELTFGGVDNSKFNGTLNYT